MSQNSGAMGKTNSNSSEGMEKLIALLPDVLCIPMVISC